MSKKDIQGPKNPWGTAQWKQMRDERIGNACEICNKTEGPMVLQHMWHPPSYAQVLYETGTTMHLPEDHPQVRTRAYKLYQADHQRYISGVDSRTFCEKCAYMWDKHGLRLCRDCGQHYHPIQYKTCKQCAKRERDRELYGKDLFENLT